MNARSQLIATPEDMFGELMADLPDFAPQFLKIRTKNGQVHPWKFNAAQKYIHSRIEAQLLKTGRIRAIALKGRQQGASTYITGRHFRHVITNFGKRAYILTHEQKATDNLFDMVSRYYQNLDPLVKPLAGHASAKELYFKALDSGYLVGTAGTKGTGRSGTVQYFHGSEVAFWDNANDHMAGVGQAVPNEDDTEVILESTANGIGNFFHQKWQSAVAAEEGEADGDYIAIFVPWMWQTEYRRAPPDGFQYDEEEEQYAAAYGCDREQMYWRRLKIRDDFEGDVALFDQEYPATPELAFRSHTPDCLIPATLVAGARKSKLSLHPDAVKLWGLDPAEYGDDRSALAKRQGRVVPQVKYWKKRGPEELVGLVAIEYDREPEPKPKQIAVDISSTVAVHEGLLRLGLPSVGVHFGEAAFESEIYKNRRAEMWWDMLAWFRDKPTQIPDEDALQADLVTVKMKPEASRKRQLESKEAMKRRGLNSPDGGDAVALTFANKFTPSTNNRDDYRDPRANDWRVM